jgi:hypothetical protein
LQLPPLNEIFCEIIFMAVQRCSRSLEHLRREYDVLGELGRYVSECFRNTRWGGIYRSGSLFMSPGKGSFQLLTQVKRKLPFPGDTAAQRLFSRLNMALDL